MGTPSKPTTNVDLLMEGVELVPMSTFSPKECVEVVRRIIDLCKPHLKYLDGHTTIRSLTFGDVAHNQLRACGLSNEIQCHLALAFAHEHGAWFKDPSNQDHAGFMAGKKLLLTHDGALFLFEWEVRRQLTRVGRHADAAFEIQKVSSKTTLSEASNALLEVLFTPGMLADFIASLNKMRVATANRQRAQLRSTEELGTSFDKIFNSMDFRA